MSVNVFIHINYGDTYESVSIEGPGEDLKVFQTGDPIVDFARADVYGAQLAHKRGVAFMTTSSLNHFVFDVPGYRFNSDDLLERDPRDYRPDGTLKTRAEIEAESD